MKLFSIALAAALAVGALSQGQPKRGKMPGKLANGRSGVCAKICAAKRSRTGGKLFRNQRVGKKKQPKKRGGNKPARKNLKKRAKQIPRHAENHVPEPIYVYPTYAPTYPTEVYVPEEYPIEECWPSSEQFKFYLSDEEVASKIANFGFGALLRSSTTVQKVTA